MIISGIESNRYFLFNPIWVDVSDVYSRTEFTVAIDGEINKFNLFPYDGKIRFDLGKLVLGLIKNIKNKDSMLGAMDGAYSINLSVREFSGSGSSFQQIKYFILGGKKSYDFNVEAPNILSLTNFAWSGFPRWTSRMQNGIVNIDEDNYEILQPRVNCSNIFLAFRNNFGGFSYYLFEDYEIKDNNSNKGYYLTQRDVKVPGVDAKSSITVRSKVHRNFYETIRHLADSFEVYLWNQNIIDSKKDWIRINGSNNNVSFNPKNIATEVEMTFDLVTNFNKVW